MKIIKDYIQFAINNGYKFDISNYRLENSPSHSTCYGGYSSSGDFLLKGGCDAYDVDIDLQPVIEMLTSKPFIKAIAKGLWDRLYINTDIFKYRGKDLKEDIIINQALAISNGELEEFIDNLLK